MRIALFDYGAGNLHSLGKALEAEGAEVVVTDAGMPSLGICLGMQLLFDDSEESEGAGIGLVPGRVTRLEASVVPQMGWNDVETADDPVFEGVEPLVAYYANSYVCEPDDPADAIAWSEYEGRRYAAAVRKGRSWGMQFHPEKSSGHGRRIIANWVTQAREAVS